MFRLRRIGDRRRQPQGAEYRPVTRSWKGGAEALSSSLGVRWRLRGTLACPGEPSSHSSYLERLRRCGKCSSR
jgi:hypothetical protein